MKSPGQAEDDDGLDFTDDDDRLTVPATGTAIDEFLWIYLALGLTTRRHAAMGPAQVDAADLSMVAVYLGVGDGSFDDESEAALAERAAAYEAAAAGQVTEPTPGG